MTLEEEERLTYLRAKYSPEAAAAPPVDTGPGFFPRLGERVANIPGNVVTGLSGFGNKLFGDGSVTAEETKVPDIFDIPAPVTTGQHAADLLGGIGQMVAESLIPGGMVSRGARLFGAGAKTAAFLGDVGAGAYIGQQQSPEEAAIMGTEFGAMSGINRFLPGGTAGQMALRGLANAAVPVGSAAVRGEDPLSMQTGIQAGAQAILGSGVMGGAMRLFGKKPEAEMSSMFADIDEVIPPGQLALPGPTTNAAGRHWNQLEWPHGEARTFHPSEGTIILEPLLNERGQRLLPGPTTAPAGRHWNQLEWPHGDARNFSPSGPPIAPPPPPSRVPTPPELPSAPYGRATNGADLSRTAARRTEPTQPLPDVPAPLPNVPARLPDVPAPLPDVPASPQSAQIAKLRDQLSEMQAEHDYLLDEGDTAGASSVARAQGTLRAKVAALEATQAAKPIFSKAADPAPGKIVGTALRFKGKVIEGDGIQEHREITPKAMAELESHPDFEEYLLNPKAIEHGFIVERNGKRLFETRSEGEVTARANRQLPDNYETQPGGMSSQDLIEHATTTQRSDLATVEVPLAKLTLSKDVPQFKAGADTKGIVESLAGKFDRRGVGPIAVWERNDGRMEVISGRHRYDLATRSGETTMPAQVYREKDGFTVEDAARLDAELNIRDSQGSVADYAAFFRSSKTSREAADAKGLLGRAKGETGYAIASGASEDAFALHQQSRITDSQAQAIANGAPGNADVQRIGIRAALEGKSASHIANLFKAYAARKAEPGAKQIDLLGSNDAAMRSMDAEAAIATRMQRELKQQLDAIQGAVAKPDLAKQGGVDVQIKAQARVEELVADLERWKEYHKHPDLLAITRGEAAAPKPLLPKPKPEPKTEPTTLLPKPKPKNEPAADLLTGKPDDPFNLVSETKAEREARMRAEDASAAAKAEVESVKAKAANEKKQRKLFDDEAAFTDLEANPLTRFAPQMLGALGGAAVGANNDPENRLRGAALGAIGGAMLPGATKRLFQTVRNPRAAIAEEEKLGVLPKSMRRMFPKAEAKAEAAATQQTRAEHSPLGRAVRWAEQNLNLGRETVIKRGVEKAKGLQQELRRNVTDAYERFEPIRAKVTPPEKTAGEAFIKSNGDAAAIAALDSSAAGPEYRDFLKAMKAAQIEAQSTFATAESSPKKKALYTQTSGTYLTRAYRIFTDPQRWQTDEPTLQKVVDQFTKAPEFKGAARETVEAATREWLNELRTRKGFAQGGTDTHKIDRTLYINRKDLTPEQWGLLQTLGADVRVDAADRVILQDLIRDQNIKPADMPWIKSLAKNRKLDASEQAMLRKIADKEVLSKEMRALLGEHSDPLEQQIFTVNKLLRTVHSARALTELDNTVLPDGRRLAYSRKEWEKAIAAADAIGNKELATKLRAYNQLGDSPGHGRLAKKWVDRQVVDTLNAFEEGMQSGFNRLYAKFNSLLKENLTVLNPATHARQWLQVPLMGLTARVYNPLRYKEAWDILRDPKSAAHAELVRLNIIGANFSTNDLANIAKDISVTGAGGNAAVRKLTGARQWLRDLYGMPDDMVRTAAFLDAKPRLGRDKAVDFVNRYTMNYGAQNRTVNMIKHLPVVSPFISYSSEMARIIKNLGEDIASGSAADRIHASLALGMLFAMPAGAVMAAKNMFLADEDRKTWEKIEALQPEYQRSQLKIPLGRGKGGEYRYFNLTPAVPAGDYVAMIRNAVRGDLAAFAAQQPFFGFRKSPVLSLTADIAAREDFMTKTELRGPVDYAQQTGKYLLPPLAGFEGQRILRSFTPNNEGGYGIENARTGRRDAPADAARGLFGLRTSQLQPRTLFAAAKMEANEAMQAAWREAKLILATNASDATKEKAKRRLFEKRREIAAELQRKLEAVR